MLAEKLSSYARREEVVVLGLPRGGVPVAWEVASALPAPLDVLVVRKLGVPGHEELAMGAVAAGGACVINADVVRRLRIDQTELRPVIQRETQELDRRARLYRGSRGPVDVAARTVIVIDDGLATGATMRAAVKALRALEAALVVVAAPVGARETCTELSHLVDEVVCARTPEPFGAVGCWYGDFAPTTEDDVRALLEIERGG